MYRVIVYMLLYISTPFVYAGDEDLISNPYSVFDPETGFYIPISELPPEQQKLYHQPATQGSTDAMDAQEAAMAAVQQPDGTGEETATPDPVVTGNNLALLASLGAAFLAVVFGIYKFNTAGERLPHSRETGNQ